MNWLVWLLPLVLLAGGGWAIVRTLRRTAAPTKTETLAESVNVASRPTSDDPYLEAVRAELRR
jgi:cytochrome c-type biogenesis protein CcmH/NrfF